MAGNYHLFYLPPEPLYTKEELLVINDTIQNNTIIPEPEKFGAKNSNKKSKVSLILWLQIKKYLKKFEDSIYNANDEFFHYNIFDISDFLDSLSNLLSFLVTITTSITRAIGFFIF